MDETKKHRQSFMTRKKVAAALSRLRRLKSRSDMSTPEEYEEKLRRVVNWRPRLWMLVTAALSCVAVILAADFTRSRVLAFLALAIVALLFFLQRLESR